MLVDPYYNPNLKTDITTRTLLGPGVSVGKFVVNTGHGLQTFTDQDFDTKLSIARNLLPQVEFINSINGQQNKFSHHRVAVVEGIYFAGEGETVDGYNESKAAGRTVVYALYGQDGKIDATTTYDLAVFWKDYFNFDELALSYDTINPDGSLNVNIIVTMPTVPSDFTVRYSNSVNTYFNNTVAFSNQLVELTI